MDGTARSICPWFPAVGLQKSRAKELWTSSRCKKLRFFGGHDERFDDGGLSPTHMGISPTWTCSELWVFPYMEDHNLIRTLEKPWFGDHPMLLSARSCCLTLSNWKMAILPWRRSNSARGAETGDARDVSLHIFRCKSLQKVYTLSIISYIPICGSTLVLALVPLKTIWFRNQTYRWLWNCQIFNLFRQFIPVSGAPAGWLSQGLMCEARQDFPRKLPVEPEAAGNFSHGVVLDPCGTIWILLDPSGGPVESF